jgi:adenine phosphoribosyltransferase
MEQAVTSNLPAPTLDDLKALIREIPDFPTPGILFRDITPLLADPAAFNRAVELMAEPYERIDHVVCIESRGFILGAPIAYRLGAGLVPVRKAGRLPAETLQRDYALEYGTNTVEIHEDAIQPEERVIVVDDLLATGGTIGAAISLVEQLGAELVGVSVLIELAALGGRERLARYSVRSLIVY